MNKYLIAFACVCVLRATGGSTSAQTITGHVTKWIKQDAGIAKVIVQAYRQDSDTEVGNTLTDDKGQYELASLPLNVAIQVRFMNDDYIANPSIWTTTLTRQAPVVHDEKLVQIKPGNRGHFEIDPKQVAAYLRAKAAESPDRAKFYQQQWSVIEKCIPSLEVRGQIASALIGLDVKSDAIPAIKADSKRRETE